MTDKAAAETAETQVQEILTALRDTYECPTVEQAQQKLASLSTQFDSDIIALEDKFRLLEAQ